ncbi:MAG: hotdog fold thioesterase [Phocaeicola sp.]|nr:hotdog fold thioesterase [Phocaeicola sp.]MDD7449340.1 hotdog fold thioesterase [Prevotellaceae bacterium]MDY5938551.1 hotdog fold thioesterase [Phocaeicola sp.]
MEEKKEQILNSSSHTRTMVETLGIEIVEVEDGYAVATMPVDERTCQVYGILNGGASVALQETVAGVGSVFLCGEDEMPCGAQISANHIAMVPVGNTVKAIGKILHKGRTTHIWSIDVVDHTDNLISTSRVVNIIVKRRTA